MYVYVYVFEFLTADTQAGIMPDNCPYCTTSLSHGKSVLPADTCSQHDARPRIRATRHGSQRKSTERY